MTKKFWNRLHIVDKKPFLGNGKNLAFLLILFISGQLLLSSCSKDDVVSSDPEVGKNSAPVLNLPDTIRLNLKNNPTTAHLKSELLKWVSDDYTEKSKLTLSVSPEPDFTKEGVTNISVTATDDGKDSKGNIGEKKSTVKKTAVQVAEAAITAITLPNFSESIQIGTAIDLLEEIQPAETTVEQVMIGDENVEIVDPHSFSPEFPGNYTISYVYTNKEWKKITATTTVIVDKDTPPVYKNLEKYDINNQDIDKQNPYRNQLAEKFGDHSIQVLALDLLEYDGYKNLTQTEALQRVKSLTPLLFDKSMSTDAIVDGPADIFFDKENSRNYALKSNKIIDNDYWWRDHTAMVANNGFGYYNGTGGNRGIDFGTGGKVFEYLQQQHDHKGVVLLTTNDGNHTSEQIKKYISKITSQPDKQFIIFRPNSWGFDLYDDPNRPESKIEKQNLIDKLHEIAELPNVLMCIGGTSDSNIGTIVSEDETPGPRKVQKFPASVRWRYGASSSDGDGTWIGRPMPTSSKQVPVLLARAPDGQSSSRSVGDVAGQIFGLAATFPQWDKNTLHKEINDPKNAVPVTTQDGDPATEIQLDKNLIAYNELLPHGLPKQLNYGDKVELFPDNEWIKEEKILVQWMGVIRENGKWYLDTKLFAKNGGFTNANGTLANSVEAEIEISIPKAEDTDKYLFQWKRKMNIQR